MISRIKSIIKWDFLIVYFIYKIKKINYAESGLTKKKRTWNQTRPSKRNLGKRLLKEIK